ncbi:MAG: CBS domain-containing protein [Planctomycetes bacterium]|nr:CBS domain-containing protein [Planctomycetota bacterium]
MQKMPIVEDFMDKVFETVKPDTRMGDAVEILLDKRLTGICVVDDDRHLLGILSEKDCLKTLIHDGFHRVPDEKVERFMHATPQTVRSGMGILEAAQIFLNVTFRRLPVVDDGKLVGQITRRDIMRGMSQFAAPNR